MAPSRPTFTKFTSQMCIFLMGPKLRHPVWRFTSDRKFLTVVWDITGKTMNERIMTDKVKWVKRTTMVSIRNSDITEPKFTIQANSSETFNKRGAHYLMSIVAGCILCVAVSPGEYMILLWLRHEINWKLRGVHNNEWVFKSVRGSRHPPVQLSSFQQPVTQAAAAILVLFSTVSGGATRASSFSKWSFESEVIIDWI